MSPSRLLLLGLVAFVTLGCAATRHQLTADGLIDVAVDDRTGWTLSASLVEPPPSWVHEDWGGRSIQVRNVDDAVLQVGWWGGRCDEPATTVVSGTEDAIAIHVYIGKPCEEQQAVPRVLRLTFDRAIDSATVDASVTGGPPT